MTDDHALLRRPTSVSRRVLYQERTLTHFAWHALMASIAAASATATLSIAPWTTPFPLALCFVVWTVFAIVRVTVTTEEVSAQCGIFGPTIPVEAIESAEVIGGDRAVRVRYRTARGSFTRVIASRDPAGVAEAITRARRARDERAQAGSNSPAPAGAPSVLGAENTGPP